MLPSMNVEGWQTFQDQIGTCNTLCTTIDAYWFRKVRHVHLLISRFRSYACFFALPWALNLRTYFNNTTVYGKNITSSLDHESLYVHSHEVWCQPRAWARVSEIHGSMVTHDRITRIFLHYEDTHFLRKFTLQFLALSVCMSREPFYSLAHWS